MDIGVLLLTRYSTEFRDQFSIAYLESDEHQAMKHFGYSVDADPVVFQHFLDFASTRTFPLLYKDNEGFDRGMYERLRGFAGVYGVPKLHEWIDRKRFEEVVSINYNYERTDAALTSERGLMVPAGTKLMWRPDGSHWIRRQTTFIDRAKLNVT